MVAIPVVLLAVIRCLLVRLPRVAGHVIVVAEAGDLVHLGDYSCRGGKWHDLTSGRSYAGEATVVASPGDASELVCVRGLAMMKMAIVVKKQNLTFTGDPADGGVLPSETFNLSCSVEFWSHAETSVVLYVSDPGGELESAAAERNDSVLSASLTVSVPPGRVAGAGGSTFTCGYKVGYEDAETESDGERLRMRVLHPVSNVGLNRGRPVLAGAVVNCTADGYPEPDSCGCSSRSAPEVHEGRGLRFPLAGVYLVNCTAENSIRGEAHRATWIGYVDVQSAAESAGSRRMPTGSSLVLAASSLATSFRLLPLLGHVTTR